MAPPLASPLAAPPAFDPADTMAVTGTVPDAIDIGYRFRMDDELLEVRAFGRMTIDILGGAATQDAGPAG